MELATTAIWVAIGTSAVSAVGTGISAIYDALTYHRPKDRIVHNTETTPAPIHRPPSSRRFWIMAAFPLVAWLAVGFDYVDRHYFSIPGAIELPLSASNARLDMWKLEPALRPPPQSDFHLNIFVVNKGNATALGLWHIGAIAIAPSTSPLDEQAIDGTFAMLRAQAARVSLPKSEIQIGDDHTWFTVPPVDPGFGVDTVTQTELGNGSKMLYVYNLMKYRDNTLDDGRFIYTETCIYYIKSVQHLCDSGHNRNYISN